MDKNLRKYLGSIHEVLFSLNIAFAFILKQSLTSPFFLELRLQYRINGYLNLPAHNNTGGYLATAALAVGLALCIFLGLQFLLYVNASLTTGFLRFGGVVSLVALPACWFYVLPAIRRPPIGIESLALPVAEVVIAVALAVLYLSAKWWIPDSVGVVFLVLHNWFWGRQFFERGSIYFPWLIFPLVGFLSSLVWAMYVASGQRVAAL